MAREKLDRQAIDEAIAYLDGWTLADDGLSISRTFTFRNFSEAFVFMTRAALAAEKLDHRPDWTNVYRNVEVKRNTTRRRRSHHARLRVGEAHESLRTALNLDVLQRRDPFTTL